MNEETVARERRLEPRRKLELAVIDDDKGPRIWIPQVIIGTPDEPGPIPDANITTFARPLPDIFNYQRYDGVILDKIIPPFDGVQIAADIRAWNWRKPVIMLLTGLDRAGLPLSIFDAVHYALSKDDLLSKSRAFMTEMRRWAAHMAQVRDAFEMGYDAGFTKGSGR